jgi:ribonuclease R
MTAYRSVIQSSHRLSYPQVESILAGDEAVAPSLREALADAHALSGRLREARFARGAARIDSREVEFTFADGRVVSARAAAEPVAHSLVEELMLLANERVAQLLAEARAPAIFRVHEPPRPEAVETLVERLAELEVPTPPRPDLSDSGQAAAYAAQVSEWVTRYGGQARRGRVAFPTLVLRALERARYAPENLGHSGLASSAYCHFTSPTWSSTGRCWRTSAPRSRSRWSRPSLRRWPITAAHASGSRPASSGAAMTSAWPSCFRMCCSSEAGQSRSRARWWA